MFLRGINDLMRRNEIDQLPMAAELKVIIPTARRSINRLSVVGLWFTNAHSKMNPIQCVSSRSHDRGNLSVFAGDCIVANGSSSRNRGSVQLH
jgi:hypothetical protein